MISGISKKIIFPFFLFINFIQLSKSAEFLEIKNNKNNNDRNAQLSWSKIPGQEIGSIYPKNFFNKVFDRNNTDLKFFKKYLELNLIANSEPQREIIIQSDKQSEINDVINAEGNVIVVYGGKILKADNIIYDKTLRKISASGNIALIVKDQTFNASQLEYNFITEKGYLLDVKGAINTSTLMDDLSSNFELSDANQIEKLFQYKKKEVLHTPGKVENWLFWTDIITVDGNKWKTKKAIFSNDLLELKQVKLAVNSLEVTSEADKLLFKSSLNNLIFEEKVSIPFWMGNRTLYKYGGGVLNLGKGWNFGYDNLDKDGYFIGRGLNSIDIFDDFVLDLEPQFLIQRSLKGQTKSFVNKEDSITSNKVIRDTSFEDYFALKSKINGRINNWDLEIEKNLNSFDFGKFSQAFRLKTELSKGINFLNSKWDKSFYGIYRERIWNGSVGESEIYSGYGSKLQKENTWVEDGIKKTDFLSLGLADITAEALNTKNLVTSLKGNLFYALDQEFPITIKDPKNKSIDISYRYIPEPITKGLILKTRFETLYSFYENGDYQAHIGLGVGPELIFGNLKNKNFDYTRLSFFPLYKVRSGKSVFKFDHNYENFTLDIALDQQLFGPIILESSGTLNLTSDSDNYGEFIDSKISLNWKRRSYEFGIFYKPNNQSGGVLFSLFGFR